MTEASEQARLELIEYQKAHPKEFRGLKIFKNRDGTERLALAGERPPSESGSDDEEDLLPPGPLDPEHCTLSGPGFTGGAAGQPVSFVISAKDSRGKRIREGGALVAVKVTPLRGTTGPVVEGAVQDQDDGTYTVTYTVPHRGNYELDIRLDGEPIGNNPFPVFFSPPDKNAASPLQQSPATGLSPSKSPAPASAEAAGLAAAKAAAGALSASIGAGELATTAHAGSPALHPSLETLGAQAHAAGVMFPADEDTLSRTLLVGSLSPMITADQIKQLFGFCGMVRSCRMVGNNQFCLVEYTKGGEAEAALGLNNTHLGERPLKVDTAKKAKMDTPQGAMDPYAAVQLQQMQQLQQQQMQTSNLAAQVAQMRALAKTNPSAAMTPSLAANSASQKAAAMAAAALLQKKFGQTSGPHDVDHDRKQSRRSRSRSADRRRRRSADHRSASRKRRSRSPGRARDRERERERERQRERERERERREKAKERERQRERERWEREREREKERQRERERQHRSDRHRSTDKRDKDHDRRSAERRGDAEGVHRSRDRNKDVVAARDDTGKKPGQQGQDQAADPSLTPAAVTSDAGPTGVAENGPQKSPAGLHDQQAGADKDKSDKDHRQRSDRGKDRSERDRDRSDRHRSSRHRRRPDDAERAEHDTRRDQRQPEKDAEANNVAKEPSAMNVDRKSTHEKRSVSPDREACAAGEGDDDRASHRSKKHRKEHSHHSSHKRSHRHHHKTSREDKDAAACAAADDSKAPQDSSTAEIADLASLREAALQSNKGLAAVTSDELLAGQQDTEMTVTTDAEGTISASAEPASTEATTAPVAASNTDMDTDA